MCSFLIRLAGRPSGVVFMDLYTQQISGVLVKGENTPIFAVCS